MASTGSTLPLLQNFSLTRVYSQAHRTSSPPACIPPKRTASVNITLPNRRQSLFMLTASTALTAAGISSSSSASAKDIPFFGIRKKLEKVEKEAVEILKEGSEAAEKGIEAAEKEIVNVEQEIVNVEQEIESAGNVNFGIGGSVTQAGIVLGAEAFGVLVATSVVSGILGPEGQN